MDQRIAEMPGLNVSTYGCRALRQARSVEELVVDWEVVFVRRGVFVVTSGRDERAVRRNDGVRTPRSLVR